MIRPHFIHFLLFACRNCLLADQQEGQRIRLLCVYPGTVLGQGVGWFAMSEEEREQARQWLTNLAALLEPWQLVLVSGNDLFAAVMVWTYTGAIHRADSLAALRALLSSPAATEKAAAAAGVQASPTAATPEGLGVPAALRPVPQRILPVGSASPGSLPVEEGSLFFLLCDDLPDGEPEEALELLQRVVPPPRRRMLCVLGDASERSRLREHQAMGVDGLCTLSSLGQGRIYTALAAIAQGGSYVDPHFQRRLRQSGPERALVGPEDLAPRERRLLRDVCRGYNNPEIADRHGLAHNSVRRYLSQAYQRIGVRDRAQAIGWCVAHGVISARDLQQIYLAPAPEQLQQSRSIPARG
jgi:DNA-binding NarL/FixJ family response regulator